MLTKLRRKVAKHKFLFIIDDDVNFAGETGLEVHDSRGGRNLGTWIESEESLAFLVRRGATAWLESEFNFAPSRKE